MDPNYGRSAFDNYTSGIANQGRVDVQGGQHNYFGSESGVSTPSRTLRFCVPLEPVPNYVPRRDLSSELVTKLKRPDGLGRQSHGVAVTGLGGTGKTQLVLRYILDHKDLYHTIIWIDARSTEAALSSFERVGRELGLRFEATNKTNLVQGVPSVQAVLSWLRNRRPEEKWLAILDNADELRSWDVSSIIPTGESGTVIVTSQDSTAGRLFGSNPEAVKVDAMGPVEAQDLLWTFCDPESVGRGSCQSSVKEIVESLDCLPLAIGLAGARIRVDINDGSTVERALEQYLSDFQRDQSRLLKDDSFAAVSRYKKNVWTVWETSISSLRRIQSEEGGIYPVELLGFMSFFKPTCIQTQLFRQASVGMEKYGRYLNAQTPQWLRVLLKTDKNFWDDFSYRATMRMLLRYGLVRPTPTYSQGTSVHGLVAWRAKKALSTRELTEYGRLHIIFMTAISMEICSVERFEVFMPRIVAAHVPAIDVLLQNQPKRDDHALEGLLSIATVLRYGGRCSLAEELHLKILEIMPGKADDRALRCQVGLAHIYVHQGRLQKAEQRLLNTIETCSTPAVYEKLAYYGPWNVLSDIYVLQKQWENAERVLLEAKRMCSETLGDDHAQVLNITCHRIRMYFKQGRSADAIEMMRIVEQESPGIPERHVDLIVRREEWLAYSYERQGRWAEAEKAWHSTELVRTRLRDTGRRDPDTFFAMWGRALACEQQSKPNEAAQLVTQIFDELSTLIDKGHPIAIRNMELLAMIDCRSGRVKDAFDIMTQAANSLAQDFGEANLDTARCRETSRLLKEAIEGRVDVDEVFKILLKQSRTPHEIIDR